MDNKILFCGCFVPNEVEAREPGVSSAGNRFQNNLMKNMSKAGIDVSEASFLGMPLKDRNYFAGKEGYVLKERNLVKSVMDYRKLVKKNLSEVDTVICYNIIYAWLFLPSLSRKNKVRSIAIIADYSEEDSFSSLSKKLYVKLQRNCMRKFDTVVGLSANIEKQLKNTQKFILLEGGIDREFYDCFSEGKSETEADGVVTLMYSGLLEPVTGVDRYLEAIKSLPEEMRLRFVFTGKGSVSEKIIEASTKDSRIEFKGNLDYSDYIAELKKADILINPRNMELPENRNNFPSKVLDYLATGSRVISTKFVGWEKFADCFDFTEDDLSETIKNVCEDFTRSGYTFDRNREFAKQFIWDEQIKKILND